MTKIDSRYKHPELKKGEVFLTNIDPRSFEISRIGWKTKRIGNSAYDKNGIVMPYLVPIFVKQSELKAAKKL